MMAKFGGFMGTIESNRNRWFNILLEADKEAERVARESGGAISIKLTNENWGIIDLCVENPYRKLTLF